MLLHAAVSLDIDDIKKLCLQLRINAAKLVTAITVILDDEAMLGYQPSKNKKRLAELLGIPIPVMYMQRKLHLNGLLLYLLACAVEHANNANGLPFILDFLPHTVVNDTALDDTIHQFKSKWAQTQPFPDIIGK